MQNTLATKFTIFFWSIFFLFILGIYLFSTGYLKEILQESENEKVQLLVTTLKPLLSMNLSFEQTEETDRLLETIYKTENIQKVLLHTKIYSKELSKKQSEKSMHLQTCSTTLLDPLSGLQIGTLTLKYSNKKLQLIEEKIQRGMMTLFVFALLLFMFFYLLIKKELNILNYISKTLDTYAKDQVLTPIKIENSTSEIQTIAHVANTMMQKISSNIKELQSFNKHLEHKVDQKVKKLHEQEQMMIHQSRQAAMGEMLESIAHQWRQPLNIIGLASSNLELENSLGIQNQESFQEKIAIISDNINYMSNTIDDFRDFLNPNREESLFHPAQTLKEVLKIVQAQLKNNAIEFFIDRDDEILFHGVENEFKQVLFVLINNSKDAIKSQQEKGQMQQNGQIHIEFRQEGSENILIFCDNGGGIKEDIIHSIFYPYFTTKFAASGTGIGLYIVKNIITTRMKGEINVHNTKEGCCFTIKQQLQE